MPYKHSAYQRNRRVHPSEFKKGTFRTVPQSHVPSRRKDYPTGTKMIVAKKNRTGNWAIQSVLIPKRGRK